MLNAYYRQQNYKPIYALRSSFSLLLQVPFFIAAYHYLSNQHLLKGSSFLFFRDLGAPDQLIHIGALGINILPIIMTLINVVSGYIYLRGFPLRDKIQTYGIAAVFLVLLYNSPSGLVFYWTLNQIFSVLKNVFMKLIKNRKVLNIVLSVLGLISAVVLVSMTQVGKKKALAVAALVFILFNIPTISMLLPKRSKQKKIYEKPKYSVFLLGGIVLTILLGILIPITVISSSPAEFVGKINEPATLVVHCLSVSMGYFLVWMNVFYYLGNNKGRTIFSYALWILSLVCTTDYLFFGKNLGNLSTLLIFDNVPTYSVKEILLNLVVIIILAVAAVLLQKKAAKIVPYLLCALCIGTAALSAINTVKTTSQIKEIKRIIEENGKEAVSDYEADRILHFSKNGKNVIVMMLDRAVSGFVPYIFAEKPELNKSFSGFVYFPNAISYGSCTNYSTPSLFGGYEYTPLKINERDNDCPFIYINRII